ncbi:MAG TPA: acyltransferase [Rhizomicrobium sp.]|jgi:peptidoglycan/LPS O-acetylase OafA/YrhL|nr:acyltransferase [Rhizomicrobium sp.]
MADALAITDTAIHLSAADKRAGHIFLDVMRGLMAIQVFSAHTFQLFLFRFLGESNPIAVVCNHFGRHGVLIFFLLSGRLITGSVINNIRKNGKFQIRDYVASRVARIYPPLIGAIIICAVVWAIIHLLQLPGARPYGLPGDLYRTREYFDFHFSEVLTVLTMQGGFHAVDGPLWTLFIEVQIYTVVLGIAAFWQRNLLARMACVALAIGAGLLLRQNGFLVLIWAGGAATCFIPLNRRVAGIIAAAMTVITVVMWMLIHERSSQASACVLYAMCLFYCFPRLSWPGPVRATADFSYSLYVMHWPLLMLATSLSQDWIGHSILRAILVAGISYVTIPLIVIPVSRLLERPHDFRKWLLEHIPEMKKTGYAPPPATT